MTREPARDAANESFVGSLQRGLAERGFYDGNLDSWAGDGTQRALEEALGWPLPIPDLATVRPFAVARAMFPDVPETRIMKYLPAILDALKEVELADPPMLLMALATIRAETAGFRPISEGKSRFNTDPGAHPFNRYDDRRDLGNTGRPDGDLFKGRGFVQLTGRANYTNIGKKIGVDLVEHPEKANEPEPAARILAVFLKSHEAAIRAALSAGDLRKSRRLVNGGQHGLDRFSDAFRAGTEAIA